MAAACIGESVVKSDLSLRVAALAAAVTGIEDVETRLEFCEMFLGAVAELSAEAAQLCAVALSAQDEGSSAHALGEALQRRVGPYEGEHFGNRPPLRVDVLLVTVKPIELLAVQEAFGIDKSNSVKVDGQELWPHVVGQTHVAIVSVGFAGNVDSAHLLTRMWCALHFQAAVLIGMAAGIPDEVNLGDVIVAEGILGYDSVNLEETGVVPAYDYFQNSRNAVKRAIRPSSQDPGWALRVQAEVESCPADIGISPTQDYPIGIRGWRPKANSGIILAGSKLVENGKLPEMKKTFHDRAKALEMEGCGFAAVCREAEIRWLVVRGIADFGQPGRRKDWQFAATYAAAALVRASLLDPEFSFLLD